MIRIVALSMMVLVSATCFGQATSSASSISNGKTVYTIYCMSCHMEDGKGIPASCPSLVGTGNLKDKNRLVKIILQGMRGPLTANGEKFDMEMAPINLTDQEVADVINYIRNTWGNKAPLIKAGEVPLAKKAVLKGYQPF